MLAKPAWRLEIAGRDVTRDVSPYLVSYTYADRVEGGSDTLDLAFEDVEGKWRDAWYPTAGDRVRFWFGDQEGLTPAGTFEIEELGYTGPPDTLTIRALATGPKAQLRTRRHETHEKKTLRQIADVVAGRNGLRVMGTVPAITLASVTQGSSDEGEHDLAFLAKLAADYGLAFSVRGDDLVFTKLANLEAARSILTLDRADLDTYDFRHNLVGVYKAVQLAYHSPKTRKTEKHSATARAGDVTSGDTLVLHKRAENGEQAQALADAALARKNGEARTGNLTLAAPNRLLVAGVNLTITGLGVFSRKWHVTESVHALDRSAGASTAITVKGV